VKFKLAVCVDNTLVLSNNSKDKLVLDLTEEFDKSFFKVGTIEFEETWPNTFGSRDNWFYSTIFTGLFLFLGIMLLYRKKLGSHDSRLDQRSIEENSSSSKTDNLTEELLNAIEILKSYKNSSLEIDRFDEILGLNLISNIEYRRVKRSRLIKMINQNHKMESGEIYIERIKSETDKRLVLYRIT
jgi:hypothetical protein